MNQQHLADVSWNMADVLPGSFKQFEFGRTITAAGQIDLRDAA